MWRRLALSLFLLLAVPATAGLGVAADAPPPRPADYVGTYVGRASDEIVDSGPLGTRDMDIVISAYKDGGLAVDWTNVTLVDGRRDVPGVQRRVSALRLVPAPDKGFLVEASDSNPFKLRDEVEPLAGDAVRWAAFDAEGFHVYSFLVLEDGRYELQTYTRRLTDTGLELLFERVVEGTVVRRIRGHAVRAE